LQGKFKIGGKKIHKISRQFVDLESFFTNFLQFQRNVSKLVVNQCYKPFFLAVIINDANQTPLDMISGGNLDKGQSLELCAVLQCVRERWSFYLGNTVEGSQRHTGGHQLRD
jgi:hypothetical protein